MIRKAEATVNQTSRPFGPEIRRVSPRLARCLAAVVRLLLCMGGITAVEKMVHGQRVRLPTWGHALSSLFFNREYLCDYEEDYFDAVLKRICPSDTVFDVGAYKGIYTVFMSRAVGAGGKVVAFEPHPAYYEILVDTVRANNLCNVVTLQKALGNEVRQARFWISGTGSSLQPFNTNSQSREIDVEVTTVDRYVESAGHTPQVLKLDVEGFELHILEGAGATLTQCRVVCCEMHPAKMRAIGREPEQLLDYLANKGYEQIYEYIPLKHKQDAGRAYNAIFERTKP